MDIDDGDRFINPSNYEHWHCTGTVLYTQTTALVIYSRQTFAASLLHVLVRC
jgi:hypothetical protein